MDYSGVKNAYDLLLMLNRVNVMKVVDLLLTDGEMTILAIAARLKMDYNHVQQILQYLKKHDLLIVEKEGKFAYFTINRIRMQKIIMALEHFNLSLKGKENESTVVVG